MTDIYKVTVTSDKEIEHRSQTITLSVEKPTEDTLAQLILTTTDAITGEVLETINLHKQ